jgi:Co/Zn/Cd efflux system component
MNATHLIRQNKVVSAIFLFFLLFILMLSIFPSVWFENNGSIRAFGVGYKKKTILPAWLLAVLLGILSYVVVLCI